MIENLIYWVVVSLAAMGLGNILLRFLSPSFGSASISASFALGAGYGLLSYLMVLLGSVGMLQKSWVLFIVVAIFLITVRSSSKLVGELLNSVHNFFHQSSILDKAIIMMIGFVVIMTVLASMAPAVGQDELCYHLTQPKRYVEAQRFFDIPYSTNSAWPFLMEMLFTLGLLVKGAALAKLFHTGFYLTTILTICSCARLLFDRRTALYAGAIFALTPAAFMQATFAYIDHALACYFTLAYLALMLYVRMPQKRYLFLSGAMTGLAISSKLIGIFCIPALFAVYLIYVLKNKQIRSTVGISAYVAGIFIFGAFWYIRSYLLRGNPVFPFYPQWFGGSGWDDATYVDSHGVGQSFLHYLTTLWDITMYPKLFGGEHIGPVYLMLIPLLIFIKKSDSYKVWPMIFFCLAVIAQWFVVDPNIRFLFGVFGIMAVLAAVAYVTIIEAAPWLLRILITAMVGMGFFLGAGLCFYHFKDDVAHVLSGRSDDGYLMRHERSYSLAKAVNAMIPKDSLLLSVGEIRVFYFDMPVTLEGDFYQFTHYSDSLDSPKQVYELLKQVGFTHILLQRDMPEDTAHDTSSFMRLTRLLPQKQLLSQYFKSIGVISSHDIRYDLFEVK